MSTLFRTVLCLVCLGLPLGADEAQPPVAQPVATPSVPPKALPVTTPPVAQPVAVPATPPKALPAQVPVAAASPLATGDLAAINASAKGLAGIVTGAPWEKTPEWQAYKKSLDGQWAYLDEERLKAMRTWGATELADLRTQSGTVFYPFSGPDVLYANTFFPNSRVLLMAGLEPVGTMPDLNNLMAQGKLGPYLDSISKSLFTILAASFFKTKDMKVDFNNQLVDGLVPAMVVFIARDGYAISDIQYVSLNSEGGVGPRSEHGKPGVQITYGDGRQVLYFSADLSDEGLKHNPGFVKLMHKLAPGITYLKAASYLCYYEDFSTIRDAILAESVGVVEDDSGVPFHFFDPAKWTVIPYGDYTGPIDLFKERKQPDLTAYYAKTPHAQLPFGSGYKFHASVSSLLVVKKKG